MRNVCIVLALVMLVAAPLTLWSAEDGAALYKSKNCGACHGEKGEGKAAMKMPAVKGTKLTAEQIVTYLTKGEAGKKAPHSGPVSGVTEEQAKALADHVIAFK